MYRNIKLRLQALLLYKFTVGFGWDSYPRNGDEGWGEVIGSINKNTFCNGLLRQRIIKMYSFSLGGGARKWRCNNQITLIS